MMTESIEPEDLEMECLVNSNVQISGMVGKEA